MSKQTKRGNFAASLAMLASKKFDGAARSGIADNPRCLGDVSAQQFYGLLEHLYAMNDQQLSVAVADLPHELMEVGTACVQMNKWHQAAAEVCAALTARIACAVAKNMKRLDQAA